MLTRLQIENFTAFRKAEFEFVPGINILVGGNGTGKTHALKLLYAVHKAQFEWSDSGGRHSVSERTSGGRTPDIGEVIFTAFRPEQVGDLIRHSNEPQTMRVVADWEGQVFDCELVALDGGWMLPSVAVQWSSVTRPVFIPVKDMLAHSVGFLSLYEQRDIDFDSTQRDILSLAFTPSLRPAALYEDDAAILQLIAEIIGGRVEVKGQRFYIVGPRGRIEMHLVAEGWRKLAVLYQLIANGFLYNGSVLYWDEPETNLNPSLMDEVVGILLRLARRGVQIFLATHDYIILKELELQQKVSDTLRMFAMERQTEDGAVIVRPAAAYDNLKPNLIEQQFERIYDLQIERALGG